MKAKRKGGTLPSGGPKHSNRIGEIRVSRGLTRKALALRLGCHDSQVFKIERGDTPLTLDWMYRLCKALGCTLPELVPEWTLPFFKQEVFLRAWAELGALERVAVLEQIGIANQNTAGLSGNLPESGPKNALVKVIVSPDGTYELEVFAPQKENQNPGSLGETKQKDKIVS
jgi:transcriptional regulator with XRE-family HTH domain